VIVRPFSRPAGAQCWRGAAKNKSKNQRDDCRNRHRYWQAFDIVGLDGRCLSRGRLFCRLAVLRQRLFELLLDTEGVGGGVCPEYCVRPRS
jgi:hypothetical protein